MGSVGRGRRGLRILGGEPLELVGWPSEKGLQIVSDLVQDRGYRAGGFRVSLAERVRVERDPSGILEPETVRVLVRRWGRDFEIREYTRNGGFLCESVVSAFGVVEIAGGDCGLDGEQVLTELLDGGSVELEVLA